jgi:hypothetical protein
MNKNMLAAVVAALTMGAASAETIYIGGSTAFGSVSMPSMTNVPNVTLLATDNAELKKAKVANFRWVNGGTTNLIKVSLSGSEGGIQSVAGPDNAAANAKKISGFYADSADRNVGGTNTGTTESHVLDFCFSDTWQGASRFVGRRNGDGINYSPLNSDIVAVLSFCWAGSKGIPASNITTANIRTAYTGLGFIQLSALTGSNSNINDFVYVLGRDRSSGTRLTALAESGIGAQANQHARKFTSTNNLSPWGTGLYGNINHTTVGDGGESSGSTIAAQMTNTLANNDSITGGVMRLDETDPENPTEVAVSGNAYMVGYCGTADALAQVSKGVVILTYNGVECTQDNIITGKYPFWSYQHMLINNKFGANSEQKKFFDLLSTSIKTKSSAEAFPNVALGDMKVQRTADGGLITSKQY